MKKFGIWSILTLALAAARCGDSTPLPSPTSPDTTPVRRVVVLGDSLAVSPSPSDSFPARLQARITQQRLPWTVTNAGVNGDTTADGVRRVDALLDADVGVLVVELGANDGLRGIDTATIERNLSTIVARGRSANRRVLLCGMETPPAHGLDYSIAFHLVFPRIAQQHDVPLVPFLLTGVVLDPELNGPDGVHPNAAGAQRIADTVWPYLEPLLRP